MVVRTPNRKGQLIIPVEMRKALNIEIGDEVIIALGPDKKSIVITKVLRLMKENDGTRLLVGQ